MSEYAAYNLNRIPAKLWRRVRDRARRDGHTVRFLLLKWLTAYAEGK